VVLAVGIDMLHFWWELSGEQIGGLGVGDFEDARFRNLSDSRLAEERSHGVVPVFFEP
jgi:hypothetical protein